MRLLYSLFWRIRTRGQREPVDFNYIDTKNLIVNNSNRRIEIAGPVNRIGRIESASRCDGIGLDESVNRSIREIMVVYKDRNISPLNVLK
jgi:hypothetical protein